jgi:hypothetical protein
LLDQLDAVESDGDVEVRTGRKEMVRTVERELGVLEGKVRAMWKKESGVVEEREEEEKEQATQEEMEVDAHLSEEDSQHDRGGRGHGYGPRRVPRGRSPPIRHITCPLIHPRPIYAFAFIRFGDGGGGRR